MTEWTNNNAPAPNRLNIFDLLQTVAGGAVCAVLTHVAVVVLSAILIGGQLRSDGPLWGAAGLVVLMESVVLLRVFRTAAQSSGGTFWFWTVFAVALSFLMLTGGMCFAPIR
jgi:hypothetical protein